MSSSKKTPKLEASGVKRLKELLLGMIVTTILLLVSAGRIDWWPAWAYLGLSIAFFILEFGWMFFIHKNLIWILNMRGKTPSVVKPWDKIIYLFIIFIPLLMIVAGLDARFGWSSIPLLLQVFGAVMFLSGNILGGWALFQNVPSLTTQVGIEKKMKICTTGPYAYVRHPMYIGQIISYLGTPLVLGSYLALIPGLIITSLFITRTILEDRDLQAEVPAYREYAKKVRFKLVPGIW